MDLVVKTILSVILKMIEILQFSKTKVSLLFHLLHDVKIFLIRNELAFVKVEVLYLKIKLSRLLLY